MYLSGPAPLAPTAAAAVVVEPMPSGDGSYDDWLGLGPEDEPVSPPLPRVPIGLVGLNFSALGDGLERWASTASSADVERVALGLVGVLERDGRVAARVFGEYDGPLNFGVIYNIPK